MTALLITSSLLILVVAALRMLLRGRIRPRVMYALWLLVVLRLLIPVTPVASPVSVLNAVEPVAEAIRPAWSGGGEMFTAPGPADSPMGEPNAVPAAPEADSPPVVVPPPTAMATTPLSILPLLWLAGAVLMGAWLLGTNLAFRRKLKRDRREIKVPNCSVPIFVSTAVPSPCLLGVFRPKLYLTPDCLGDETRLRHILAHEHTHLRQLDHLWAALRCLCLCLYWFNPLVWLAANLSRRDCELACDEGTLRKLGEGERVAYGRTLLAMAAPKPIHGQLLLAATTMSSSGRGLKERVTLIVKKPKMLAITLLTVMVIAAVAVVCTFTGADNGVDNRPLAERLAELPKELRGTVVLETGDSQPEGTYFTAYYAEDYGGEMGGWLCTLEVLSPVDFEQGFAGWEATGGYRYLGLYEGNYYVEWQPTDVNFDPAHQAGYQAASQAVSVWLDEICSTQAGVVKMEDDPVYQRLTAPASYPGNHINVLYQPYLNIADVGAVKTDTTYVLLLSQPVRQGSDGIWCVDRWTDGRDFSYLPTAKTDKTQEVYYADLQAKADAGEANELTVPASVAMQFITEEFGHWQTPAAFRYGEMYQGEVALPVTEVTAAEGAFHRVELMSSGGRERIHFRQGPNAREYTYLKEAQTLMPEELFTRDYEWKDVTDVIVSAARTPVVEPDADGTLTILSADSDLYFRFYSGSNRVLFYDKVAGNTWYEVTPSAENDQNQAIFPRMRSMFDNLERYNANPFLFTAETDFTAIARLWGEELAVNMKRRIMPGNAYEVQEAALYSAEVYDTIPGDEKQFCFHLTMAYKLADPNAAVWQAGGGVEEITQGEYAGWWADKYDVLLNLSEEGLWYLVQSGTSGVNLDPPR